VSRPVQIAVSVVLTIIAVLTALYMLNRFVWFYRDPKRVAEGNGKVIISPADGQIVYIKRFEDGAVYSEKLGRRIDLSEIAELPQTKGRSGWICGIYMSPFDVHFNYAPVGGTVTAVRYTKADANLPMVDLSEYIRIAFLRRPFDNFAAKFHLENERNTVLIQPGPGSVAGQPDIAAVEIADKFVNKIDVMVDEGQPIATGDKIGFIRRGSQVDVIIFAEDITWEAEFGQQTYGGQTVLARWK
jgi:phosphatidylserine decarboxylase